MKKNFSILAWLFGIPLFIILVFAIFGFLAIRFNFWPPNCGILPIKEMRQVCEFSKLEKAPKGKPAKIIFWTTVPYDTPATDKILLAIEGKELVEMKRINETSFETTVSSITGDKLKYRYLRNNPSSLSDEKELAVKSFEKTVYDYVSKWSDKAPSVSLPKSLETAVEMYDTWTINYNMQLFEDTRKNLDSAMARIKAMGGKEIGIYSFIDMAGDKDNFTVAETHSPYYHWRDAAITESEMKTIVKKAKKYGLKIVIRYNIGADYNKYYNVGLMGRFTGGQAGSGFGGNAAEEKAGKDFGRYEPKTKEWLDRYFNQLKGVLVEWAKRAENAGINAFDIHPHYKPPTVDPLNDYADTKWLEIIAAVRAVYAGKIYFDGNPKFRDAVDGLYYGVGLNVRPNASIAEMRDAWKKELKLIEAKFFGYEKPIFVMAGLASFDGALSGAPGMEFLDYAEVEAAGYKRDWQEQADGYEAFFQALSEGFRFVGFGTRFFSWDDMMGPEYIPSRYSDLASNIRNKPAEAVWKKWVLSAE